MTDSIENSLLSMTTDIVTAHLSHNTVDASDVAELISQVHAALAALGKQLPEPVAAPLQPPVPIRSSVKPDYIVCLEDGKKLKMLKRYLRSNFDMSPEEYRAKWKLPFDYPMVAPNYSNQRRHLALEIGLGKRATPRSADLKVVSTRP